MFFIGTDRALRQRFEPRRNDVLLSLPGDPAPNSNAPEPKEGPLYNGVGSIQLVRPPRDAATETSIVADAPMVDDGLSAARGIAVSVAFGFGFWSLIGGLVGMFIF